MGGHVKRSTLGTFFGALAICALAAGTGCRSDNTGTGFDATGGQPDAANSNHDANNNGNQDGSSNNQDASQNGMDATTSNPDASTNFTVTTVQNAVNNYTAATDIEVDNVVIVAENHYTSTTNGGTVGTFWIQDVGAAAGPGLSVYHSSNDSTMFPTAVGTSAVGYVVNIKGHLSKYSGDLQISSHSKTGVALSITVVSMNGTTMGGAESPAGNPITVANAADYAHTNTNAHPEQVSNVIKFGGPLTVTNAMAFVSTGSDGGTKPEGFEITGSIWVNDSIVYHDCLKTLDGGVMGLNLNNGIRGVWSRYSDYYSSMNPPTYPVLTPTQCSDLTNP
jgi:hypothetical protein